MYADKTLTPKEAIRLCALGTLTACPLTYSALATAIRHFVSRVVGPTPEIMGHSIELLRYEGLIETEDGEGDGALLRLTQAGRAAMKELLTAKLRPASNELNKLVMVLKFRFLHLLEPNEQRGQVDLVIDALEGEMARLESLRAHHVDDQGFVVPWLDHDMDLIQARIDWLGAFRRRVDATC